MGHASKQEIILKRQNNPQAIQNVLHMCVDKIKFVLVGGKDTRYYISNVCVTTIFFLFTYKFYQA